MASAAIATNLGQHRQHIVPKTQFLLVIGSHRKGECDEQ